MNFPLAFLVWRSLHGRIRSMLRKLKRPKYLASVLAGGAYFWWFLLRPMARAGRAPFLAGGAPADVELIVQSLVGLAFLGLVALQTLSREHGLMYHENELLFLLAAPVSRAGLLRLKLLQPQPGLLITALLAGWVVWRMPGGSLWAFPGMYALFNLLLLFRIWWSLQLCALRARGVRLWMGWVGLLLLGAVGWAGWRCYRPPAKLAVVRTTPGRPAGVDAAPTARYLAGWLRRAPLRRAVGPLRLVVGLAVPGSPGRRAAGAALLALVGGLLALAIFRSRAPFIEPSLALAGKITRIKSQGLWAWRREQKKTGQPQRKLSPPPFELQPRGLPWVAIFWKNMLCAGSRYTPRVLASALLAAVVAGLALGRWPGLPPEVPATAAVIVAYVALLYSLILVNTVRNDLRRDIPNFIYLRALPISGFQLLLGEVLAPTAITAGMAAVGWTFCACAVGQVGQTALPLAFKLPVYLAGLLLFGALALAYVSIENCIALMYPGWVQLGPVQQGGFDKMGQNLLGALARMMLLMLGLVVPAIGGGLVVGLGLWAAQGSLALSGWVVLAGALVGGPLIVAECLLALWFAGKLVYPRFDISAEIV